jgi:hypothetical protein
MTRRNTEEGPFHPRKLRALALCWFVMCVVMLILGERGWLALAGATYSTACGWIFARAVS